MNDKDTNGNVSDFAVQYKYEDDESLPFEKGKLYTYSDYCTWDDDRRWELIDGVPYAMASPSWGHQGISRELLGQLYNFLKGKPCKVFAAPLDVRLNAFGADNTVVQPDIIVICDDAKLGGRVCDGAPDMAAEILSPSSVQHDLIRKLPLYEKSGIREYWILDPENKALTTYILDDGRYFVKAYGASDSAPVHVLPGCVISLTEVFAASE